MTCEIHFMSFHINDTTTNDRLLKIGMYFNFSDYPFVPWSAHLSILLFDIYIDPLEETFYTF